jgi:hypothetical protein
MSRSSVSSDMSRAGSNYGGARGKNLATAEAPPVVGAGTAAGAAVGGAAIAAAAASTGKFSALAQRTQQTRAAAVAAAASNAAASASGIAKQPQLLRLASDSSVSFMSAKPKLIRQTAILADGDSTCSGKSVTFKDTAPTPAESRHQLGVVVASAAAQPEQPHQCPVHSADYLAALSGHYRSLYNQLIESNQEDEESDMEASDDEAQGEPESDHLPLGTSFRTISAAAQAVQVAQSQAAGLVMLQQPQLMLPGPGLTQELLERTTSSASSTAVGVGGIGFLHRKLSTISSKGSFGKDDDGVDAAEGNETTAVIEQSPKQHEEAEDEDEDAGDEREALLSRETASAAAVRIVPSSLSMPQLGSATKLPEFESAKAKVKKPYLNTDV